MKLHFFKAIKIEIKEDWKRKNIESTILDYFIRKRITYRDICQKIQKCFVGNNSLQRKGFHRNGLEWKGLDWKDFYWKQFD